MSGVGIGAVGAALPSSRIALTTINEVWQNEPMAAGGRGGVQERAVLDPDADVITLAAEAATTALEGWEGPAVRAVFLGSQTGPYLTRASAAVLVDILGLGPEAFATDMQFAGKSGTAALLSAYAFVRAGLAPAALAIGADTLGPHVAPGDPLEYTAGSGAAAVVVTSDPELATIDGAASWTSDTADSFRVDGERYIRTGGTLMTATGIGFLSHTVAAVERVARSVGVAPSDVDWLVTQQPDASAPLRAADRLGVSADRARPALLAGDIGDTGAASPLLGLIRVLESAEPGARVIVSSYGAGAGSDALVLTVRGQARHTGLAEAMARRVPVDYPTAVRYERRYDSHQRLVGTYE